LAAGFLDTGFRLYESSNINIRVVVPSNQDSRSTLAQLQEQLELDIEQPLVRAREKWEMFKDERDASNVRRWEDHRRLYYEQINDIQMFNCDAGPLWAGSGFRVHPENNFGLDWALVKLPDHRSTPNLVRFFLIYPPHLFQINFLYELNRSSLIYIIATYI
jgi:hypothetical protein